MIDIETKGCHACGFPREDCICEPSVGLLDKGYFRIDTDERAEWLIGKLSGLAFEQERIKSNAADMIARLQRQHDGLLNRFGAELEEFAKTKLEWKSKTVQFLQGKVNWRTSKSGGPRVTDTEAALQYCQEHDELVDKCVSISYRLRTTDYLKIFEETGEILPGIEVTPVVESDAFYVNGKRLDAVEATDGATKLE